MKKLIKETGKHYIDSDGNIFLMNGEMSKGAHFTYVKKGKNICISKRQLYKKYFPDKVKPSIYLNYKYADEENKKVFELAKILKHRFCNIKRRCYDITNKQYADYGKRGIKIYDQWLDDSNKFVKYCLDNGFKKGLTIDRINNNEGYFPDNLRFVDSFTQNNNTRSNIIINYNAQKFTLSKFCKKYKLNYKFANQIYHKHKDNMDLFFNIVFKNLKNCKVYVRIGREYFSLKELSNQYNIKYHTIKCRYVRGDRGDRLIRPLK